jgi:hypothetical protein
VLRRGFAQTFRHPQRVHLITHALLLFPAKNTLPGFGAGYIAQHDCAARRGNNFRRQKIISVVYWGRKLVRQSSEKNIFERTAKIEPFTNLLRSKMF